jgi:hypothetical protein
MLKIWIDKEITVHRKPIGKPRMARIQDYKDPIFCLKCGNHHGRTTPCEMAGKIIVQPYREWTIERPVLKIQWVKDPQ